MNHMNNLPLQFKIPLFSKRALTVVLLVVFIFVLALLAASLGVSSVGLKEVWQSLLSLIWPDMTPLNGVCAVVFDLRLPRVILAVLSGMCLALSGAAAQGVLMNPMVSPFVLGVAPGSCVWSRFGPGFGCGAYRAWALFGSGQRFCHGDFCHVVLLQLIHGQTLF